MFDRNQSGLALLFQRSTSQLECRCSMPGYCPCCGEYHPASTDPEVLGALADRRPNGGHRVLRKRLES